jgi:hypothetical protein
MEKRVLATGAANRLPTGVAFRGTTRHGSIQNPVFYFIHSLVAK